MTTALVQEPPQFDLKMPQGYNFNTRNINWNLYKPYYILRTDAVWEKSKLYAYFYSLYKSQLYFNNNSYYLISDQFKYYKITYGLKGEFSYEEIGENSEHHHKAKRYTENGEIFEFDLPTHKNTPRKTSHFLGDSSKEMTLLCMIKFFKWMRCNQKSEIKLSTVNNNSENPLFLKYDCYRELKELEENCIRYHFKVMFELYYFRVHTDYKKWNSDFGLNRLHDVSRRPGNSRTLYY